MNAQYQGFGRITIDGASYSEDVVVDRGTVRVREKSASRALKRQYGHTPLSEFEPIPWDCSTLIVGTGAQGRLPITTQVGALAEERGVTIVAVPTDEACRRLNESDLSRTNAILHLTC